MFKQLAILAVLAAAVSANHCSVSNGILTLFNANANVQCVKRSDTGRKYIQTGGNIVSPFIFGGTVKFDIPSVSLTLYQGADCKAHNDMDHFTIACTQYANSTCVLYNGVPTILNVAAPVLSILRDDTKTCTPVGELVVPPADAVVVPLNGGVLCADLCPAQINLMKNSDCTGYLATQEIMCPCPVCMTYINPV